MTAYRPPKRVDPPKTSALEIVLAILGMIFMIAMFVGTIVMFEAR